MIAKTVILRQECKNITICNKSIAFRDNNNYNYNVSKGESKSSPQCK